MLGVRIAWAAVAVAGLTLGVVNAWPGGGFACYEDEAQVQTINGAECFPVDDLVNSNATTRAIPPATAGLCNFVAARVNALYEWDYAGKGHPLTREQIEVLGSIDRATCGQ